MARLGDWLFRWVRERQQDKETIKRQAQCIADLNGELAVVYKRNEKITDDIWDAAVKTAAAEENAAAVQRELQHFKDKAVLQHKERVAMRHQIMDLQEQIAKLKGLTCPLEG